MSLLFMCIEVRKNLQCANVFMQFDQSLQETEFVKITLNNTGINLREYSTETNAIVDEFLKFDAKSMSSLIVHDINATFRVSIQELKDIFDITAIPLMHMKPRLEECITIKTEVKNDKQLKSSANEEQSASFHCSTCKYSLVPKQTYERIREFPSGSIDMTDFFCHQHDDSNCTDQLVPQSNYLFYGFQFVVLQRELLQSTTKEKQGHLYCRRCLQYLGETILNKKAVKLWTDTLLLRYGEEDDFLSVEKEKANQPICQLMHKIVRESFVANREEKLLQQLHFTKVLLEATFPNRQKHYLLMHILEKQLPVLRNAKPLVHGNQLNNNNALTVPLEHFKSYKLLYRLIGATEEDVVNEVASTDMDTKTVLQEWQNDMCIQNVNISPTLFSSLLHELEDNAMLLPEMYRFGRNNFKLSYIFYKD